MRFQPGQVIERREVLNGQVWLTSPVTVVHDSEDCLAVLVEPGAPFTFPEHPEPHPWARFDAWSDTIVLQTTRELDAYGVWKFFDLDGRFMSWYINFEAPIVRHVDPTGRGAIDTLDHGIDIVIPAGNGGGWHWKDYDDPNRLVELGRLTRDQADAVMRLAHDVAADLDAGQRWWAVWDDWAPITANG